MQSKLACTNTVYFNANAFIAKIGPGGSPLVYSTYFGGTNYEQGRGIAVDTNGFVYVAGSPPQPIFQPPIIYAS